MKRAKRKNILSLLSLTIIALFAVSCDKNIARPEDLAALTSVSVGELSVGSDTLVLGEGTTISWDVTDAEGIVESVELVANPGNTVQVATSGTRGVQPEVSTLYTLNVYVDGEVAKSRSVYVEVMDIQGNIIDEVPTEETPDSETACSDASDDDEDGAVDCIDSDCVNDTACVEPTYEFTTVASSATEATLVGETVTITWTSSFDRVKVARDNVTQAKLFNKDDVFEFTAADEPTVIVLIGMVNGGEYASSDEITVDASVEAPEVFDEEVIVEFTIDPTANLLYGQSYELNWVVDGDESLVLDGQAASSGEDFTATESKTHILSVTDHAGEIKDFELPITVNSFASNGVSGVSEVEKIVSGDETDEYYFLTSESIRRTGDALSSAIENLDTNGINFDSYTITSLTENNGILYAGSTGGVYVKESAEASFKPVISTGTQSVTSLYGRSDGVVLVGTVNEIFQMQSCEDSPTGYCQSDYDGLSFSYGTTFSKFIPSSAGSTKIYLISDVGVYESSNGGTSFTKLSGLSDVADGSCSLEGGCFLWSNTTVYELTDGTFKKINDIKTSGIRGVGKVGDYYLVATNEGVEALYIPNGDYFTTNIGESTDFLIQSGSTVRVVKSSGEIEEITIVGTEAETETKSETDNEASTARTKKSVTRNPIVNLSTFEFALPVWRQ